MAMKVDKRSLYTLKVEAGLQDNWYKYSQRSYFCLFRNLGLVTSEAYEESNLVISADINARFW